MNIIKNHKQTHIRIWRIANAILLWLSLILPWMRVDISEDINAFVMAIIGGYGSFEITASSSLEEFGISLFGFLFSMGVFFIVIYATIQWVYGISDDTYSPKSNLRLRSIVFGIIAIIIITAYFYYLSQGNSASDITGYALIGYWLCWTGLISSALFEIREFRLKHYAI